MTTPTGLPKTSSGIGGLDSILEGGLPTGRVTLVEGGAGTGKTVLGMQFLYRGAQEGEPGLLVSFEERAEFLRQNALSLGWDFAALERNGALALLDVPLETGSVITGEFTLTGMFAMLEAQIAALGVKRVVIDALDVPMFMLPSDTQRRSEMYRLMSWLSERGVTAMVASKEYHRATVSPVYSLLEFTTDCVIRLETLRPEAGSLRRLRVVKYRGSDFARRPAPFIIVPDDGVVINAVSSIELAHEPPGEHVSTGNKRFDDLLSGGYRRGSSVLLAGLSGTGKTMFCSLFSREACRRGEKVLYVSTEESPASLRRAVRSGGIDLDECVEHGTLHMLGAVPESAGVEEHLYRHLQLIERERPAHVIVDSISPLARLGDRRTLFRYTVRLLDLCRRHNITVLLTQQTTRSGLDRALEAIDFASLLDTVVVTDYTQIGGEVNRIVLVLKARGMSHSNQFREFVITDEGIQFFDVFMGKGGMLTGVARQEQQVREDSDRRRREQGLYAKEREIEELRRWFEAESASMHAKLTSAESELESMRLEQHAQQQARVQRTHMRRHGGVEKAPDEQGSSGDEGGRR